MQSPDFKSPDSDQNRRSLARGIARGQADERDPQQRDQSQPAEGPENALVAAGQIEDQAEQRRHGSWPLRLGAEGTDTVVRSMPVRCTHYDAFRFFTPGARPLNKIAPTLEARGDNEQPGCVHVTMDLFKWAMKACAASVS